MRRRAPEEGAGLTDPPQGPSPPPEAGGGGDEKEKVPVWAHLLPALPVDGGEGAERPQARRPAVREEQPGQLAVCRVEGAVFASSEGVSGGRHGV